MTPMLALVAAVFTASLVGSLHCAGMCGAFVVLAAGGPDASPRRQAALQAAYHVGRLITYTALGAAAGLAGQLLNLAGTLAGLSRVATILAGGMMIVFAVVAILRAQGVHISRVKLPAGWTTFVSGLHRRAMGYPPIVRSGLIGLLTTLLPCGWLYAFAVTAAGTGHALTGAIVMAVFWAGTLPALIAVGTGIRQLLGPIGRRAPLVTALLLIAAGIYTLVGRAGLDTTALAAAAQSTRKTTIQQQATVPDPAETPACCRKKQP